ncbi:hypothetical protein [Ancylobacter sp. TS-1]|uniref:alginate O-acetyltransferase AlgX-related protein n=1 Tax=Ancylobacter sp. TS-1 TaxID=1850374 RepID=UPI001265C294|nr:hypothetical protein [Ancylobacter sp. TS-1]QFR33646.1 hypothetical protein GBB76_11245 [Ancylobacter sp. TS-1]
MTLLLRLRRWLAVFFFAVLCLPALGLFLPDLPAPERTALAPAARWWRNASRHLDPYINDTFGFRGAVLAAHGRYLRFIGSPPSDRVLEGENGALFIRDDATLEQSLGQTVRPGAVAGFVDFTRSLDAQVTALGGRFVALIAPNAQTVTRENLPAYARRAMKTPTEYDLIAERMAADGIPFVDLRPLMEAAKKDGPIYFRYDTHWNERGALLAFNAAMDAAGRPDLAVSPEAALGPPVARPDGDLLRLAGLEQPDPPDRRFQWQEPFIAPQNLAPVAGAVMEADHPIFHSEAFETGHAGPRIMVVGDSFTRDFWRGLIATRSSAFAWAHHRSCRFDRGLIERFRPDILIYIPVERYLPCDASLAPAGVAAPNALPTGPAAH